MHSPTNAVRPEIRISLDEADEEFELAAAAAETKRSERRGRCRRPSARSADDGPSPRIAKMRGGEEAPPKPTTRASRSPARTSPVRAASSTEDLQSMAAALRKKRGPCRRSMLANSRSQSLRAVTSADLETMRARHSTGGRSLSPKRGPRRIKSGGDLFEPAHRSKSPCRPCISSSLSPKMKPKGKVCVSRTVSFGSKCYEEIPKAAEEEKTAIWYDKAELKDLRKQVKKQARKGRLQDETEDCFRGLEPYVQQFQRKSDDGSPTEAKKCNQILLELTELEAQQEKRKSEELKKIAEEFLSRFSEEGAKAAAQDEAEARAIYLESMDAEQVSACFKANACALARGA